MTGDESILSAKREFKKACEELQNSENNLCDINAQIKALQERKQAAEAQIEQQKQNCVNKGLQYYSEDKRILNQWRPLLMTTCLAGKRIR